MKYKAILFDMDGTLLPMDMEEFTNGYFKGLYKKLEKYGVDLQSLAAAIWAATGEMVKNDGAMTNAKKFWSYFEKITGLKESQVGEECLEFYRNEFHEARAFTGENPYAKEAVELAKKKADKVILATNPLFPMDGQTTRMSWIGLEPKDFALVTSYESDCYCKPNPKYFLSICERMNLKPEECLMIGNDEYEDMFAAQSAGMDCYLVTDCQIQSEGHPWDGPKGSFLEMKRVLEEL